MTAHRPVELDLDDHADLFDTVVAVLDAVQNTARHRGGLTRPEVHAAADELVAWLDRHPTTSC